MENYRLFNIFTKDSFRERVERSSDGKLTVIYDNFGEPSIMMIVRRKKIMDVLDIKEEDLDAYKIINEKSNYPYYLFYQIHNNDVGRMSGIVNMLKDSYPCFKYHNKFGVYRRELPEFFISIFPCTVDNPSSFPGGDIFSLCKSREDYRKYSYKNITDIVRRKGPNWRLMSIWEYSFIKNYYLYNLGLRKCSKGFRTPTGMLKIEGNNIVHEKNKMSCYSSEYRVFTIGVFVSISSSLLGNIDINSLIGKELFGTESNTYGEIIDVRKTKIDYSGSSRVYEQMLESSSTGLFFVLRDLTGNVFYKKNEKVKILDRKEGVFFDIGNVTSESFILGKKIFGDNLNFVSSSNEDVFYDLYMFFDSYCSSPTLIDGLFLRNNKLVIGNNTYVVPTFFSYKGQFEDMDDSFKTASNELVKKYGVDNGFHNRSTRFKYYSCMPVSNLDVPVIKGREYLRNFLNFISFVPIYPDTGAVNWNYLKNTLDVDIFRRSLLCSDINRKEIYHNDVISRFNKSSMFVSWDIDYKKYGLLSLVGNPSFTVSEALFMFLMGFNNNYLKLDLDSIYETEEREDHKHKIDNLRIIKKLSKVSGNFFLRAYDSDFYVLSNGVNKLYSPSSVSYEMFDTLEKIRKDVRCIDNPLFNAMFHSGGKSRGIKDDPHPDESRFDRNVVNDDSDMLGDVSNKFVFRTIYIPEYY